MLSQLMNNNFSLPIIGINSDWLDLVLNKSSSPAAAKYHGTLIEKLLSIIHTSSQPCEYKFFIKFIKFQSIIIIYSVPSSLSHD